MATDVRNCYQELTKAFKQYSTLGSISSVLQWDMQVNMPPKGAEKRANELAMVSGLAHERLTSKRVGELISTCKTTNGALTEAEQANVREMSRDYDRATKVPQELVEELSRQRSLTHDIWGRAREKADFSLFAPELEKLVELTKQLAEAYGHTGTPYDALVDEYEAGATVVSLTKLFDEMKAVTVPLAEKVIHSKVKANFAFEKNRFTAEKQKTFGEGLIEKIGFDRQGGRLDTSIHPFCSGGLGDVRLTTRYNEHAPQQAIFGIIHEMGHGLYEQGVAPATYGTPLSEALSYGIHESQSRMWENYIGRSLPFWKCFYPQLTSAFGNELAGMSVEDWVLAVNHVERSLVRVEADELTYDLHIILRFEIERDLFAGVISVSDLPKVWNQKVEAYLGITPPNDGKEGVMQDVHWSGGSFGYFPSYSVGNIAAGQMWKKMHADMPTMMEKIEKGNFGEILAWLRENVHQHGRRFTRDELMQRATGKALGTEDYLSYLTEKFSSLYKL
ncbi:MAG: carboxypeptidase M32 [bacterium]|nr:carboxypeptidase M32 [bacterium]